ncbi:hypothetical protein GCM10010310_79840 [Streptomyces violaceolatus]|uniref:DNA-binding protein n=1 Tax=Streptomyces violaceolatus TaxID=67378 RepID=A0ABN3TIU1_9ACTN|nr:hypothetical protein [Streptomyces sp. RK76]MBQ0951185.1 hypothetical protein [Streptomyces sp. RK76]
MSRTTIRRRREAGELPGAVRDDRGWLIPVEDLLAAGFRLNAPAAPDEKKDVGDQAAAGAQPGPAPGETAAALQSELDRLRGEHALALADECQVRQLAESEARRLQARLDERATTSRPATALAALTPAPDRAAIPRPAQAPPAPFTALSTASPSAETGEASDVSEAGRRCRWWPRRD